MEKVRSGRSEGLNISALEARLSSSVSDLQQIVVDAASHYTCRVYVNVNDITASNGCGFGCEDSVNASRSCWRMPVDVSSSLLRSSMDDVISFRLALCLCAAVCLISYTAEAKAEAEAKLIMCKQEVSPPSVEVEVALNEFEVKSSQSMGHSRKRKSPLNRISNGCDNKVTLIDDKSGARESATSIKGEMLLPVRTSHPYEHGLIRKCRPNFFVQLDPGPYYFYFYFFFFFIFRKLNKSSMF